MQIGTITGVRDVHILEGQFALGGGYIFGVGNCVWVCITVSGDLAVADRLSENQTDVGAKGVSGLEAEQDRCRSRLVARLTL